MEILVYSRTCILIGAHSARICEQGSLHTLLVAYWINGISSNLKTNGIYLHFIHTATKITLKLLRCGETSQGCRLQQKELQIYYFEANRIRVSGQSGCGPSLFPSIIQKSFVCSVGTTELPSSTCLGCSFLPSYHILHVQDSSKLSLTLSTATAEKTMSSLKCHINTATIADGYIHCVWA